MVAEIELVDALRADRALQRGGRVLNQNLAVVDDGDPVAELVGLLHVMRGQDDRDSLVAQAANGLPHGDAALRIEAGAGLVEKEHLGTVGDGAGDLNALRKAAGELCGIGSGAFGEVELGEELVGPLFRLGAREAEVEAVEVDVLKDGAGAVERVVLRHHADASSSQRRSGNDIDSGDTHLTGSRERARRADADGCGLACAVGAEQAVELARPTLRSMPSTATTRCLPSYTFRRPSISTITDTPSGAQPQADGRATAAYSAVPLRHR